MYANAHRKKGAAPLKTSDMFPFLDPWSEGSEAPVDEFMAIGLALGAKVAPPKQS